MITLIVSDGLSGAGKAALQAAKAVGIRTGGYTPPRMLSDIWAARFNLTPSPDHEELNIIIADATIIFGGIEPEWGRIAATCKEIERPSLWLKNYEAPNAQPEFRLWVERNGFKSLNITGSRGRGIEAGVESFLLDILPFCRRGKVR